MPTTRKYIFSVEFVMVVSQTRRYKTLIAAAKADPHCSTIFKLLLPAAFAMTVVKNIYLMAQMTCGKNFCFYRQIISGSQYFQGSKEFVASIISWVPLKIICCGGH